MVRIFSALPAMNNIKKAASKLKSLNMPWASSRLKALAGLKTCGLLLAIGLLTACSVNPVTGRTEVNLVSLSQQRNIGAEQYGPSQQSQGGEYRTDAELSAYVNAVGQRIAAVSDLPLDYQFVVLNNSVPNAWALPGGKIAVNRGLLTELNSEAELAAVLGHEVVHAAAGHGAQAMTRGTFLQGALAVMDIATHDNEYSDYIVGASSLGAQLVTQSYGREAERESDYYGIQYMVRAGYDPQAAVSLQQTFVRLSEGGNSSWLDGLFASHPPSAERVMNNQLLVEELQPQLAGRDLEIGEQRYQQALAGLRANQLAYQLSDEAALAIADGDLDIAYGNLSEAISLLPAEASFYGLQGDIRLQQKRYQDAVALYDAAIQHDDQYFDYYLGRGVAQSRLNNRSAARRDLEHSSQLLSTAVAQNELGKLSLLQGQRVEAKQYFQIAAEAGGQVGRAARTEFLKLDVQDNPGSYASVQAYIDASRKVIVRVMNHSALPMQQVTVEVSAYISGSVQSTSVSATEIAPGSSLDVTSSLSFPADSPVSAELMNARISAVQMQ